jgi:hypothetical protein
MSVEVILTSKRIESGNLLKNRELVLYVDGLIYDEFLSNSIRVECLNEAKQEFDDALSTAAEKFKEHEFGAYLWIYTPDFIRSEDILDLYRRLYLKSVIRYLSKHIGISKLSVEVPLSREEKVFYSDIVSGYSVHYFSLLCNRFRNLTQKCKTLYKKIRVNTICFFSRPNNPLTGALIDTSSRFVKNRYDDLKKVESLLTEFRYYSGEQMMIRGVDKNKTVVFKKEMNLKMIFFSFRKSIRLQFFLKKNKNIIPAVLYRNHRGFYKMLLYWDLIISQQCIDRFLTRSQIQYIIQVSTLTKPVYRSLIAASGKHNATFIQVASRTLMNKRCSERLLRCDVEEYSNTRLPDYYIFKDQFSKRVFNDFPELLEKVRIGGRFYHPGFQQTKVQNPFALCILLNHRRDLSEKMLDVVKQSQIFKGIETIFFRCHPSYKLSVDDVSHWFPDNIVFDLTGKSYDDLTHYKVITLTSATTASLEVVQYGSVLLWIPFIWNDSVLFDDLMNAMGIKCDHIQMVSEIVSEFVQNPEKFVKQIENDMKFCMENFMPEKLISDQIANILQTQKQLN